MEKLFERVLDDDEKIIKVFKPNKTKLYMSHMLVITISLFLGALVGVLAILFPGSEEAEPVWYIVFPIGGFVLLTLGNWLLTYLYYKNVYYAYSNKRIIIRSGIFGVDFKSLDMSMIGAVNVYVSLIDKIVRKNTGSISFGSTASPIAYSQSSAAAYKFNHIEMPYENCKEIKSFIDDYKKQVNKK